MATIIFDFDGTLADTLPLVIEIFYQLTGAQQLPPEEIKHLRQLSKRDVARELHIPLWKIPILVARGRRKLRARAGEVELFNDVPAILAQLKTHGHQLLVVSSNDTNTIEQCLRKNGLNKLFTQIYGSVGLFSKARRLHKIIRKNQINRENCWYIGDEVRDIEAATANDIRSIAVTWGYNDKRALDACSPTFVAAKPQDLLRIIR